MHKSILKTFGLALMAACSLMAMFAVTAQAENLTDGGKAGNFLVLGLSTLVAGTEFAGTSLHGILLIGLKNAYILCPDGEIKGKGLSASEILVEVLYLSCKAFSDSTKAELGACPILGEPTKEDIKATAIGLARLHENAAHEVELYVLFEGEPDGLGGRLPIAVVLFGPECGIGVKVKITGSVVALVDNGNAAVDHLITFSDAIQLLFQVNGVGDKLLYGANEAFIAGPSTEVPTTVAHVKLSGPHVNCTWAVD